ncbi:MAG: DUF2158 domain-containing protein [Candidatus Symbiothrix sp.]|nr:DUF2158 domain-containing protein [Candidatus Symbiothrix sp.]
MDKKFKIGDVVCLKSGSPKMTVVRYEKVLKRNSLTEMEESSKVECNYYDDKGELRKPYFEQDLLELSE